MTHATTTIAAVIVATDGRDWMPELLASLQAQTRPVDVIVAVDNHSTDGTRDVLLASLGPDRVLPSSRDMGFPAAANMGAAAVPDVDYLLVLHDDVVLEPDTVEVLAATLDGDPRVAVTGPKIVDHDDPRILLSMGLTLDRFGQVHDHVDARERDQGQGTEGSRHLAVTTATMLVRNDVFRALGGFDPRFEMYRDDLDLCWRVWLGGWEVAVSPSTRVLHRRAGATHRRDDRSAFTGPHYFRERNTLAAIIKNVTGPRILAAVAGFLVAAVVRAGWYAATRRFQEAWQTFQAWGWNIVNLPGTLRRRAWVRRNQRRTTAQIEHLFAGIGPQVRHMFGVVSDWVVGTEDRSEPRLDVSGPRSAWQRATAYMRRRPMVVAFVALLVVGAAIAVPLLLPGDIRLGQYEPFPSSGLAAIRDYLSAWHDVDATGTTSPPSPAHFLVGAVQLLVGNSTWLASRGLLFGLPLLGWMLAQVALARIIPTPGPRVAAATVYVLSPPAVAAMRTGRIGVQVTVALLPLVALGLATATQRHGDEGAAWRGAATAALAGAVMIAFDPGTLAPLGAVLVALTTMVALRRDTSANRVRTWTRLATVALGVPAVLFPWSTTWFDGIRGGPTSLLPVDAATSPLWQWLVLVPQQPGFPGLVAGVGIATAGVVGLALAARRQPLPALLLGLAWIGLATGAAFLDWSGTSAPLWAGSAAIGAAASVAVLVAMGLRWASTVMRGHSFGWRQVAAATALAVSVTGLVSSGLDVGRDGWGAGSGPAPLPLFTTAVADGQDHLILTLAVVDDVVTWELTSAAGDTMASYAVASSIATRVTVGTIVAEVVGQANPAASGRLGLLGVRSIVVPEAGVTADLRAGLDRQFDLRSEPVTSGLVYRLVNDAPQVGLLDADVISEVVATASIPVGAEPAAMTPDGEAAWTAAAADVDRVALVGAAENGSWKATIDGVAVASQEGNGLVWFDVPAGTTVRVTAGNQAGRTTALVLEALALAFLVSVVLRPPGASQASPLRRAAASDHPGGVS